MKITRDVLAEIEKRAREAAPQEACGLLTGSAERVDEAVPLTNISPMPEKGYMAPPQDLFRTFRALRLSGRRMLGIYHSHPHSEAYPSPTDVELAFYPDAIYVIASGLPGRKIRGFRIVNGTISEERLEIVDD